MAPTSSILRVTPVPRSVQPLPASQAILSAVPGTSAPLATYAFVEGIIVEGQIVGSIHVTSADGATTVHANADIDYKGVNDMSLSQCDWAATIRSPQLSAPGLGGCTGSPPYYTNVDGWRDTILLGGIGGNEVITAKRGGGPANDPEYCPTIPPQLCHTQTGNQIVLVTPLAATINLTSNAPPIGPKTIAIPNPDYGATVGFTVSSIPTSIHGITVPRKALSWQWIPATGDSSVSSMNCPPPSPNVNSISCAVTINEAGSIVVTARVNGVVQNDTIRVVGNQVKITPTQTSMLPSITSTGSTHKRTETQLVHVSVIDTSGTPVPFKTVVLSLVPTTGSGHVHSITSPVKPAGVIPTIVNTGVHGDTAINYASPDPSGPVWIKGRSSGAGSVQKKVKIEVPGLAMYGSEIGADMVGSKPAHPDNHWATPSHIEGLAALAETFRTQFPTADRLKYNDSSLQFGGLFDFGVNWLAPHVGHRLGHETDLQTYKSCDGQQNCDCRAQDPTLKPYQLNTVKVTWLALAEYGASIKEHKVTDTDVCPHWHLILP